MIPAKDSLNVAGAIVVVLGAVWSILRFIFTPRIKTAVETGVSRALAPIVSRVDDLEGRADRAEIKVEGVVEGQRRAERAIEKVGTDIKEGLDGLAGAIKGLSSAHEDTAREVAFIRGAIGKLPRSRSRKSD